MRNILFIALLIIPMLSNAQGVNIARKHKRLLASIEEVKLSDFLVHPSDYIPESIDSRQISHIEFVRDTNYNNTNQIYASITEKDGFDKVYSIGQVLCYQRSQSEVSFTINAYLKDGSTRSRHVIFDFTNGVSDKEYEFEEAYYDVAGDPFWDQAENMEIVAL
jgi:hypothetical protein